MPQVEVSFDIDANGIMHVSAKDKGTGREQKIEIKSDSGISKEEIERMIKDAEAHAAEDHKRREQVDARNELDSMIYRLEKSLADAGDAADESLKSEIKAAIDKARPVLDSEDVDAIKNAKTELEKSAHKLAEVMYKKTQTDGGGDGASGPSAGSASGGGKADGDDVVDADFEEVKP
jgi:molecular chaperone DnaK